MLLLKNGKIFTLDNGKILYGDILIKDNKIAAIDANISIAGAKVIDLHESIVMPGLIDGSTSLGLIESGTRVDGSGADEKFTNTIANLKTVDGIYYRDEYFKRASASGVTTVVVNSGKLNVLGSQSCAIKTSAKSFNEAIISSYVDLNCTIADYPKKWNQNRQESPLSRMGIINVIRENLFNAKLYLEKKENNKIDFDNYNSVYESLISVLKKEVPLKITTNRIQDILKAIEIKEEFNINIILNSAAESYQAIKEITKNSIPVILGSCLDDNSSVELQNRRLDTAKILSEKGILTSVSTNHPDIIIDLLLLSACLFVKNGMSYENALNSITINTAKIFGLDKKIGSITIGKDADLVILDGDPLKSMTKIKMTIIDGNIVYER